MKFDPIALTEKIPVSWLRKPAMDLLLAIGIPFNRWLGMRIEVLEDHEVVIVSPPKTLRQNHVGGAHACALALLGEYASGLLIAKKYGIKKYRVIIASLSMQYHKQGRGTLHGQAKAPTSWPEISGDESWIEMKTEITNEKNEAVATCLTRWQIKPWARVGKTSNETRANHPSNSELKIEPNVMRKRQTARPKRPKVVRKSNLSN